MDVRLVLVTGLALAVPLLPIAWRQGYGTGQACLALAMSAAVWWLAAAIAARVGPAAGRAEGLVRTAVLACAVVVGTGFVLEACHALSLAGYLSASAVTLIAAAALRLSGIPPAAQAWRRPAPTVVLILAMLSAMLAVSLAFAATHAPFSLYDAISYHLYFAARWLQDHAMSILPTPFSDPSQAYEPANGELFFVWLMAPWHGDFAARAGQVPFWLLGALSLYAIARRLGAARQHAWYPALLFLVARPIVEQAIGADVDLIGSALFAASIALGLTAVDRDTRVDWAVWGVAAGLTLGSKFVMLAFLPVLLSVGVAAGPRRRAVWALPGLIVFGASWYLRNWIVAGSPIYPASLTVEGLMLARGAYSHAAMNNSIFHLDQVRYALPIAAHAFGVTLSVAAWPLVLLGWVRMARRPWWPGRWLVLVPFVTWSIFWFVLPDNIDGRFLLPALGPALVPVAMAFGGRRVWNGVLHVLCLGIAGWVIVGWPTQVIVPGPWFFRGWFELGGIVSPNSVALVAAATAAFAAIWFLAGRSRWVTPVVALLVGSTATILALGEDTRCAPGPCDRLHVSDPFIRAGLSEVWAWMDGHVHDATVAYTGINLPYPLAGSHLSNRVIYVNIDGHPGWRLHDYDRAYRAGRFDPVPPALAVASGELEPVPPRTGPRDDASRPRYERLEGVPALWIHNLDVLGVDDVFVARLSAYEIDVQSHGPEGFPVEEGWMEADPDRFTLAFGNHDARVYAVHHAGAPR